MLFPQPLNLNHKSYAFPNNRGFLICPNMQIEVFQHRNRIPAGVRKIHRLKRNFSLKTLNPHPIRRANNFWLPFHHGQNLRCRLFSNRERLQTRCQLPQRKPAHCDWEKNRENIANGVVPPSVRVQIPKRDAPGPVPERQRVITHNRERHEPRTNTYEKAIFNRDFIRLREVLRVFFLEFK